MRIIDFSNNDLTLFRGAASQRQVLYCWQPQNMAGNYLLIQNSTVQNSSRKRKWFLYVTLATHVTLVTVGFFTICIWMERTTVYPKKYAHGFVVLCFVVVMRSFIMNSHEVFIHIHQGCFAATGTIVRLPQCQWSKPEGYGKISQFITTTNKAQQSKNSAHISWDILYGSHASQSERLYCKTPWWKDICTKCGMYYRLEGHGS